MESVHPHTRIVAVEESFSTPEVVEESRRLAGGIPSMRSGPIAGPFMDELLDLGPDRVSRMDAAGVDVQVLALSAPGVQHIPRERAVELARRTNDLVAQAIGRFPGRFAALATVAPQDPAAAAAEVERAVSSLGLNGVIVNSHTDDHYLDEETYWPLLEAAEASGAPLYVHPREPSASLDGAFVPGFVVGWAYAVETGTHIVRLIASGVLDRFPNLRIVVGHLGETIPFLLERMDNRYEFEKNISHAKPLSLTPGEYFRRNFHVTTSGMNFNAPVRAAIDLLGAERVLFAADYPMEDQTEAVEQFHALDLSPEERELLSHANAERVFGLASKAEAEV